MAKVAVIGIDGADHELVQRWKNSLPNLRKMIDDGAFGILHSSTPSDSSPAWICFYTGKNPGRIGIYGFVNVNRDGTSRIVDSTLCDSLSLWEILSEYGKRVCVVNVPMTYPPRAVNGYMVSGFPAPFSKNDFTYPPHLYKELDRLVGGYQTDVIYSSPYDAGEKAFLEELLIVHRKTAEAAKYLLEKEKWDFFMVVFREIDYVQHFFWKYLDDNHHKYRNVIHDWYVRVDETIGEIVNKLDRDTYVFIMSDHGCQGARYKFCLNEWLKQKGLLKTTTENVKMAAFVGEEGFVTSFPILVRKLLLRHVSSFLIKKLLKIVPQQFLMTATFRGIASQNINLLFSSIDWTKTKAYAIGGTSGAIYINLKEHESQGVVNPNRYYEDLRSKIEELLKSLPHEKWSQGIHVRAEFSRKEETYCGKYAHMAPDLIADFFIGNSKCFVGSEMEKGDVLYKIDVHGTHSSKGVWFAIGPNTKGTRKKANIVDLAPTILYLLDVPIPEDMDGKIIKEAFSLDREVKFGKSSTKESTSRKIISVQEQKEVEERLRALGYLG